MKVLAITLVFITNGSLTGQNKEWKIHEKGTFEFAYNYNGWNGMDFLFFRQYGNRAIWTIMGPESTGKPNLVGETMVSGHVMMFDINTGKPVKIKSNWKDQPINVVHTQQGIDSNVILIYGDQRVYKATILGDSVNYVKLCEISNDWIQGVCDAGEYILSWYSDKIVVSNAVTGAYVKTIEAFPNTNLVITSIAYDGKEILVGARSLTSGGGIVKLDIPNGKTIMVPQAELAGSTSEGVKVKTLGDNKFYAVSDNKKGHDVLYRKINDSTWSKVKDGNFPAQNQFSKWYFGISYVQKKNVYFNPEDGTFGDTFFGPKDYSFHENEATWYYQTYNQINAHVHFVVSNGNDTFGIGDNVIWKLTEKSVGINKISSLPTLVLYPNPAIDFINITNPENKVFSYSVTNAQGQVVLTGETQSSVDVRSLNSGIYFMNISGAMSGMFKKE